MRNYVLSKFQELVHLIPEHICLFLGGGRGGGKTDCGLQLALRHILQYCEYARVLYVRRTYRSISGFEEHARLLMGAVWPGARYNASMGLWRFPSGAMMELGQLDGVSDYDKFQGRNFTLLVVDEVTQYPDLHLIDMLRSNLRAPEHVPTRTVLIGNPGGAGHGVVASRFVFGREPWVPYLDERSGRQTVYCPSTYRDNPSLNHERYRMDLVGACADDRELLKGWLDGNWNIPRGAFFSDVIEQHRNLVNWDRLPEANSMDLTGGSQHHGAQWRFYLAYDHGSGAPAVCFLCAKSPGATGPDGHFYPKNSIILVDEFDTRLADDMLNKGTGLVVPELAERIKRMCSRWGVYPRGLADDACWSRHGGAAHSIAKEFTAHGVHFEPALKRDRVGGWAYMRQLLKQAGSLDQPGLFVNGRCTGFWATAPFIPRDRFNPEDVESKNFPDHWCDAARYGCMRPEPQVFRTMIIPRVH